MLGEGGSALEKFEAAYREFQAREDRRVDLKGLREVIDALKVELASDAVRTHLVHQHRPADSNERDGS
jgi:hypothetical protein